MIKKIPAFVAGVCALGLLMGCAGQGNAAASPSNTETVQVEQADSAITQPLEYAGHMQFAPPQPGDTLVTLHTSMGDITIRFFPEETPLTYENFVTHARNGFYDGVIFHRVINDFMIQGGDPEGTGAGGDNIWGHPFGPEFSYHLRHFRGAVAMAHPGHPALMGSQFYIVQNGELDPGTRGFFEEALESQDEIIGFDEEEGDFVTLARVLPTEKLDLYLELGGTPHLDWVMNPEGGHTVFGHVVSGMDVVDAIATVEVGAGSRPVSDVIIQSVTVTVQE